MEYNDFLESKIIELVIPGWRSSKGICAEIEKAKEFKIPIFYSLADLIHGLEVD
jgi:hypothetical protein